MGIDEVVFLGPCKGRTFSWNGDSTNIDFTHVTHQDCSFTWIIARLNSASAIYPSNSRGIRFELSFSGNTKSGSLGVDGRNP